MTLVKKLIDIARISGYKNVFAKGYTSNWSEEVFVIKKLKILCRGYVVNDLNEEEIVGTFYENELQKTMEKVSNRKGDKLYVKWKEYNNSFNSWIDKKTSYK